MKRLFFRITVFTSAIALLAIFVNADTSPPKSKYPWVNVTIQKEISRTETEDWINALDESLDLLPPHIINIIKSQDGLNVTLVVETNEWWAGLASTGAVLYDKGIYFNEQPRLDDNPLGSEPLGRNGFSHKEKLYVTMHELAHIYFFYSNKNTYSLGAFRRVISAKNTDDTILWLEQPPTIYPLEEDINQISEDAAETFALFVFSPDILKSCFPIHYNFMHGLFEREYINTPNSIITRMNCEP